MKRIRFFLLFVVISCRCFAQPQPPVFVDAENFKILQADKNKALISMDIRLYNPNRYKLKVKEAEIEIFVNENHAGNMQATDRFEMPRHDTFLLPVVLDADVQRLLPNALQVLLSNGIADIRISGNVKAGRHGIFLNIPVNYAFKEDIGAMLKTQ